MEQPPTRRITTAAQQEVMLEYMQRHTDLALGRIKGKEGRATKDRLWKDLEQELNGVEGDPTFFSAIQHIITGR